METNLRFNTITSEIQNVVAINPMFTRAKVYVLYVGKNRNQSFISKQSVLDSLPTLYGIPIVGEYIIEKDNFGGHGGRLEITDDDVKFVQTTVPFGYVPETVKTSWEFVTEKDGTVNEYLVLDGVYLWTGRYSELNVLLEQGKLNQSMEIEIVDADFSVMNGEKVFNIHKFTFSSLCMLGVDKGDNPEDHIEPCFESASVITYNLNKDVFKREFQQMMKELKFSLDKGGNHEMEQINQEVVEETVVTEEFEQVEETIETEVETTEEVVEEAQVEEVTETVEDTFEQTETVEEVVAETEVEVNEETQEFTEESQIEGVTIEPTVNEFEIKFNELQAQYDALLVELEGLKEFKRHTEESKLASKFEGQLSEEELTAVFEASKEASLEDVEKELFALVGKKNFSVKKPESNPKAKVAFSMVEEKKPNPYGDFFK